MKSIRTLIIILFIGVGATSFAQSYSFKVMVNKGANQVKSGDSWVSLKTGSSLKSADVLKVSSGAYIGLMHSGGKSIEVRDAGTYTVAELENKVPKGKGVGSKYADYLASQMSAEGKKSKLSATGAVHRALVSGASIKVLLPSSVQLYGDKSIISWDAVDGDDIIYTVNISNMFGDQLLEAETKETSFELDLTDNKIEGNEVVLLSVSTADDEDVSSEVIPIKKLNAEKKNQVKAGLDELFTDIDNQTALNKIILAAFYEENDLLADALTSYEEAIQLEPTVEYYKELKDEFLLRNGLR